MKQIHTLQHQHAVFEVGKDTKDTYSIEIWYIHNIETDEITYRSKVVKNWVYEEKPKDISLVKSNKKYKEYLLEGTVKQCNDFIQNIVNTQGKWVQDPNNPFAKIFIEPKAELFVSR